jgi:hypothetical protein
MPWTAPQITRQNVPYVAGERQMLEAWLDIHRQTLLSKCGGLTAAQLRQRTAPPSNLVLAPCQAETWAVRIGCSACYQRPA